MDNIFYSEDELKVEMDKVEAQYDKETNPLKRRMLQNEFWGLYPRKEAKPKAFTTFKNKSRADQQKAIDHLKTKPFSGTEKQFIPIPTTYLNQDRFNDSVIGGKVSNGYEEYIK